MPRTIISDDSAPCVGCPADARPRPPRSSQELHRLFTIKTFRLVPILEATSFLILLTCSFAARAGVPIMGPIHGMLFLAYVLIALMIRESAGGNAKETLLVLVGAVVPFGGFVVDRWLARREQ